MRGDGFEGGLMGVCVTRQSIHGGVLLISTARARLDSNLLQQCEWPLH